MKNKLKANSKLIQGGIQLAKAKITGKRLLKMKGLVKIIEGVVLKKINGLVQ